jgi:hippurate hydrolase
MAANAINQYQTIMGNAVDPQKAAVLSIGSIQAGNSNNVIPPTALVKMNLRWFDPKVRETLLNNIKFMSEGTAEMQGIGKDQLPTLTFKGSSTPVVNNKEFSTFKWTTKSIIRRQTGLNRLSAIYGVGRCTSSLRRSKRHSF